MTLKEIVQPTRKELFIKEIERKILSGEWKVGDKLPTEREMEQKMKVSRTIINSGLSELAQNGFVKIVPRKGVFVGDYTRNGQLNTLLSIINFNGGRFDKKTVDSLTAYRIHLDCECASLSAKNRTEEDLKIMKDIYVKIKSTSEMDDIVKLKFDFLHAIYCSTGNNIYPLVCNAFKKVCITFNEIMFTHFGCESHDYIKNLINVIENHDSEAAHKIMYEFLTSRIDELNQFYF